MKKYKFKISLMSKNYYKIETFKFPLINKVKELSYKFWGKNGPFMIVILCMFNISKIKYVFNN